MRSEFCDKRTAACKSHAAVLFDELLNDNPMNSQGIADKIDPQIGVDFFVRTRRQTGRIARVMWRIAGTVRAKKMR